MPTLTEITNNAVAASALPTAGTAGTAFNNTFARYQVSNVSLPSGNWSVGGWFHVPADATGSSGTLAVLGTAGSNNSLVFYYDRVNMTLQVSGLDSAGNPLGAHAGRGTSSSIGLSCKYRIPAGIDCHCAVVKTGSKIQLWLTFNGHAPVLCSEEQTTYASTTTQGFSFCNTNGFGAEIKCRIKQWFKLQYALTQSQIMQIVNGSDPTSFGTPDATDWYFLMNTQGTTWTSTINSITAARYLASGYSSSAAIGYAAQTEAVFLSPPGPDGFVVQQVNKFATVALSGLHTGTTGANIQAQILDENNVIVQGWQTISVGIGSGTWSGTMTIPMRKKWCRLQLRKIIDGIASSNVMTTTLRWGIGENVMLCGQSLMQQLGGTGGATGASDVTLNGYVSVQSGTGFLISGVGQEFILVSGMVNSGGLIEVTTAARHGLRDGAKVIILGVVGTTEANGVTWTITTTGTTTFTLNGSTFTNAYVSGGRCQNVEATWKVTNQSLDTMAAGHAIIGNAISNSCDCVVAIANRSVGGTPISFFNSYSSATNNYASLNVLSAHEFGTLGTYLWLHGHANIGVSSYFSTGGSAGAWTGWGDLGTLIDFNNTNFPNVSRFGVAAFTQVGGQTVTSASGMHQFRFGMKDWCDRKIAAGDSNVFFSGFYHDLQPQWENGTASPNAHLSPTFKGYRSMAARLGHSTAFKLGGVANDAKGPEITSAVRSGVNVDLTVTQNGGSAIKVLRDGASASGFEVATDTAFTNKIPVTNAQITGANTIRLTLASDPGATVYIRYQYGQVGDYAISTYITPRVTGVADNGAGLIRVTCGTSGLSPAGSQKGNSGHGLTTGQWIGIEGVAGATQANGIWQVTVIDTTNFDLVGSSSVGLGTFTSGSNLWQSSATGLVAVEVGVPIYDNRVIGGYDTNGAPLQPTYTYLTAT